MQVRHVGRMRYDIDIVVCVHVAKRAQAEGKNGQGLSIQPR